MPKLTDGMTKEDGAMTRKMVVLFVAACFMLAACGGGDAPESLASADGDEGVTAPAEPESELEETTTVAPTMAPTSVVSTTVPPATTDAPATTAAPTTTKSTTTTSSTTTSSTTTSSTTTTIPVPASCSTANYTVTIPDGWVGNDCRSFTSGVFPAPGIPIEFRAEVDFAFTTAETFAQSLTRINADEVVLSSQPATVDGLAGQRMVLEDTAWFQDGERTVVVVDAGNGVFFASVNEIIDIQGPLQGGTLASHYAFSLQHFDAMLSTISINATTPVCTAPNFPNAVVLSAGGADIDADGVLEPIVFMDSDAGRYITVEGFAGTSGTIWGQVESVEVGLPVLGWNDWDNDGVPEFFTPGDGGASGVRTNISTINGCTIVPVVTQDGVPASLWNRASGLSANNYKCVFAADATLQSFETLATTIDADGGSITTVVTSHTYSSGVLAVSGTSSTSSDPGTAAGDSNCAITIS